VDSISESKARLVSPGTVLRSVILITVIVQEMR
jgi:hypothetical protein